MSSSEAAVERLARWTTQHVQAALAIVSVLSITLFLVADLPWTLDDYDQAKQAYTSFAMVGEGHWFYQRTPGERWATKPPLIGWTSAAIYAVTRSWEVAWRLPSLAAALALLWLILRDSRRAYGGVASCIAAGAFGLNLLSPRLALLVRTDMPLALVCFLLGRAIWQKLRDGSVWMARDRAFFCALLVAAMLVKGPIVYAFLLPGIALFSYAMRNRTGGVPAWCGWWPWLASLGVFLLWAIGGMATAPGWTEQVVLHEFAGRFNGEVHRAQPALFYLLHLLHKFAPWSVLLIALAVVHWRSRVFSIQGWLGRSRSDPATLWLVCWTFGALVVMSTIPSKRVDRIFPIVPPLCLLLAAQVARAQADPRERARAERWAVVCLAIAVVAATGYTVARVAVARAEKRAALVVFGKSVRSEAAAKQWRYEVIGRDEEGMLLYLRRLHFVKIEDAIRVARAGELDALVCPAEALPELQQALGSWKIEAQSATNARGTMPVYYLLARPAAAATSALDLPAVPVNLQRSDGFSKSANRDAVVPVARRIF